MKNILFIFLFLSQNAFASEACNDFFSYACKNNELTERQWQINSIELRKNGFAAVESITSLKDFNSELEKTMSGGAGLSSSVAESYFQALEETALSIVDLNKQQIKTMVQNIFSNLQDAISEEPSLTIQNKELMQAKLSGIQIMLPYEFVQKYHYIAIKWLFKGCGSHALMPWGFGVDITDTYTKTSERLMVVCPVMLTLFKSQPGHVQFVLAHEFAHFIDSDQITNVYNNLKTCSQKYEKQPGFFRYDSSANIALPEISSDYWGTSVTARMSGSNKETIKNAMSHFCSLPAGRAHPGGVFRVNQFGSHPQIRATLGCSNKPVSTSQACGI